MRHYFENHGNVAECVRKLRTNFGRREAPSAWYVRYPVKKVSDEADFDLGGHVSKQNCCIWGTENPHAYIEKPTHPKRATVWCGFWSRGIIGQFFLENEQGEAVTVNGDRYRAMLNEIWRRGYWQHLVPTGQRYVPHSRSYTRCFAPCFWRSDYQPQSWCRLATSELRFDYYLCRTITCEVPSKINVTPTSQRQLTL